MHAHLVEPPPTLTHCVPTFQVAHRVIASAMAKSRTSATTLRGADSAARQRALQRTATRPSLPHPASAEDRSVRDRRERAHVRVGTGLAAPAMRLAPRPRLASSSGDHALGVECGGTGPQTRRLRRSVGPLRPGATETTPPHGCRWH